MASERPPRRIDPTEEQALLDAIDHWLERSVRPQVQAHDHGDIWPQQIVAEMAEMGLFGATIAPEYGGLGLPASTYAKITMRIASLWMALTGIFNSHLIMAAAIERYGTAAQKRQWLPDMATGAIRGALALTEPNCGTDLQAIRTTARRAGDQYVLNGTKMWITNAVHGHCFAMLVKTDADADPRYRGMSLIITPKGEGLKTGQKFDKLGYRAIDTSELVLEDYRVPAANLIGGVEGQGFFQATGGLELGRINVAARGVGIADGALALATRYAQERETMGKPIGQHQAIQLKLGEMATRARAARLLTLDAARAYDSGARCDLEAGMAKYFATEAGVANAGEGMRIFGGYSYSTEYDIERLYRDALLLCIIEGTNEMQRMIIARRWLKENPL